MAAFENKDERLRSLAALTVAVLFPLGVAIFHGLNRPYTTTPDADLIYLGEAFRAAEGTGFFYVDHPGYIYVLILSSWLKLLHLINIVPLPGTAAAVAAQSIDVYMQQMTWAGRILSAMQASAFVFIAAWMLRRAGASRILSAIFALLLASSAGIAVNSVVLRAELMSGAFAFFSFGAMAISARRAGWPALAWLGAAGIFAMLALETKVQALSVLFCLPVLAIALETLKGPRPPVTDQLCHVTALIVCAALSIPMFVVVSFSMRDFDFGPSYGYYQVGLVVWIGLWMFMFASLNRLTVRDSVLAAAVFTAAVSLGFYALFIRHSHRVVDAVVNPIEQIRQFSPQMAGHASISDIATDIANSLLHSLLAVEYAPVHVLECLTAIGIAALWRAGRRRAALLSFMLLGMALANETAFGLRYLLPGYLIYIEPWVMMALVAPMGLALEHKTARYGVYICVSIFVAWSAVRAFDPAVVPVQPVDNVCIQADLYLEPELAVRFRPVCR